MEREASERAGPSEKRVSSKERRERFTGLELLGNIGGLMGLCMGGSMVSGVEIIYFFVIFRLINLVFESFSVARKSMIDDKC